MQPLGITYQQFLEICDPLDELVVEHFSPKPDFRNLLTDRLKVRSPELARIVESFDDSQIDFLWKQVVEHQKLVKWMNA